MAGERQTFTRKEPLGVRRLAEIAAGFPDGLFNVVPGDGATTGVALTADERIDEITFTGSIATGQTIGKARWSASGRSLSNRTRTR